VRKRVIIGLLVMSVLAMWGTDANAFNRINGVIIKHSNLTAVVSLSGAGGNDTLVTIALDVTVEFICKGPQDQSTGNPETQDVTATQTERLTGDDFTNGQAVVTFVFDLVTGTQCHQNNFVKVQGSELAAGLVATIAYKSCIGKEPGADNFNDGDSCFEFGGTVETTKVIEAVRTECDPGVRDPVTGSVPPQELSCETTVVGHRGSGT
jgi:hypothetical protein